MGTRITGGKDPKKPRYRAIEVGCLNTRAHKDYKIVHFKIPKDVAVGECPECGRKVSRP